MTGMAVLRKVAENLPCFSLLLASRCSERLHCGDCYFESGAGTALVRTRKHKHANHLVVALSPHVVAAAVFRNFQVPVDYVCRYRRVWLKEVTNG